jgi:hypothetical protein
MFEPLVMFFGLTNSPATFQTMMNDIFTDLIAEGHVVIYLDDILIFTKTLNEHRQIVLRVLEKLCSHKLYLKPEKREFERRRALSTWVSLSPITTLQWIRQRSRVYLNGQCQ